MRFFVLVFVLLVAGCQSDAPVVISENGRLTAEGEAILVELEAQAVGGDMDARYQVALLRHFLPGDYEAALPIFVEAAGVGHVGAMGMLALAYRNGLGVEVDYDRAAYWLEQAATHGDTKAAHELAHYRAYVAGRDSAGTSS